VVFEHLVSCRDFYRRWFGLEVVFEAMHPDHPSAPPEPEPFSGKGMCLEFQVAAGWWDKYLVGVPEA